jgi:hypothetical protein
MTAKIASVRMRRFNLCADYLGFIAPTNDPMALDAHRG